MMRRVIGGPPQRVGTCYSAAGGFRRERPPTRRGRAARRAPASADPTPDHLARRRGVDQGLGAPLVDVAEQPAVGPVADEAPQPRRERGDLLARDREQLALLLAPEARDR